jgi:exonuclease SbcD
MRLLHTSDWHLGQTLHDFDRTHEHQHFLDWLLDTLENERTELLLIAGDIFDNANPSAASQRQLYRFLADARARMPQLAIVLVAGNHDSPGRLEAPSPFLERFGATCVGGVQRGHDGAIEFERMVVPVRNGAGDIAAWCLAIPFLRAGDVPRVDTDGDPYLAGVARLYREALDLALARREPHQPIIALGHCHMRDGLTSDDSERRVVVGGAEALPAGIFDPAIAYVALGHLHLAQTVGRHAHIRYSGSPLPMSFSEIHYPHQVLGVDLEDGAVSEVRPISVPRPVPLLRVPASPQPLDEVLAALRTLDLPEVPAHQQPYLQVRVRLDAPEPALRARIEAELDGKPVRLARIEVSASATAGNHGAPVLSLDELGRLDPASVFSRLYRERHDGDAPNELVAALATLMDLPDEAMP